MIRKVNKLREFGILKLWHSHIPNLVTDLLTLVTKVPSETSE